MFTVLKRVAAVVTVAYAIAGCGDTSQLPQQEATEQSQSAAELINGTVTTARPSVGLLSVSGCTATLIGPRTVLTAAHCVDSDGQADSFCSGGTCVWGTYIRHPNYNPSNFDHDIALLRLNQDFQALTGIRPSPIPSGAPHSGLSVNIFGYGCTTWNTSTGYGTKREGWNTIDSVNPLHIQWDGNGTRLCQGDSGGPAFWGECLVGVNSHRSTSWTGSHNDKAARPDVANPWIRSVVGNTAIRQCGLNVCGDNYCDAGEDNWGCPWDCAAVCGNNVCEQGEESTCDRDCPVCGDGYCGDNEYNCDADCGWCGDGICQYHEPSSCYDCNPCPDPWSC